MALIILHFYQLFVLKNFHKNYEKFIEKLLKIQEE